MADSERRRRRSRHGADREGPDPVDGAAGSTRPADAAGSIRPVDGAAGSIRPASVRDPEPEGGPPRRRAGSATDERDGERGLRGLVGSGSSQLTVGAALRARDAARPSAADLAEAEARLTVVRRNWVPRDELPRAGR